VISIQVMFATKLESVTHSEYLILWESTDLQVQAKTLGAVRMSPTPAPFVFYPDCVPHGT